MPDLNVVIKTVPAMLVAARRVSIPRNDRGPKHLDPAFTEAYDFVRTHGALDNGPRIALWHNSAYGNEDAEAVVPIDRRLTGTDRVKVYELSGTKVASIIHFGNSDVFTKDHAALLEWINANGYKIVGPYREIYMKPDRTITEIQFPVEKV
ncbi:MAG TPA: GyrI-like domain-containing protein [Anaerolineales bacterium]|nr:GyrI-like domain-containing protein [Anaerolineales bacterium]